MDTLVDDSSAPRITRLIDRIDEAWDGTTMARCTFCDSAIPQSNGEIPELERAHIRAEQIGRLVHHPDQPARP